MPKKETRYTTDGRYVLQPGEYYREDRGTFQYKAWDNKAQRAITCSAKTLKELREKEKQIKKDLLDGLSSPVKKETLDQYYTIWKQNKRIKPNVMSNYCYMYERFVRPKLGSKKLRDLKYTTIETFYLDILDNERMAINTLEVVHNVLHQILDRAVLDDVIRRNPSDGIMGELKKRYPKPKKRKALTKEEQARFVEALDEEANKSWRSAFLILLKTGMRAGELTGLTWDDIDIANRLIHVRRTLVYFDDRSLPQNTCRLAVNSTKTVTSMRDLPLTDELQGLFEAQKENSLPCRQTVDGVTGFVFTNRFGDVMHRGTLNKGLQRIIKDANKDINALALPHFSLHHLRHTYCTNLVMSGVELTVASALMGHADIQTTANIYNDVQQEQKELAAQKVAAYMNDNEPGSVAGN